jgi:hypothetical protein
MTPSHVSRLAGAVFAACALAACSGGGSGDTAAGRNAAVGSTGTLTLSLIDTPFTEVTSIWVHITNISLKPEGDDTPIDFPVDIDVDLLAHTSENPQLLLEGASLPAGEYDWLAMDVDAEIDNTVDDSYVETAAGGEEELAIDPGDQVRVPSGRLRLVSGLTITADEPTRLMVDWDARRGLVHPPGQHGYLLRPAFRVVDMTEYGTLSGTVDAGLIGDTACLDDDANDADVGNAVYIYRGDVTPDDLDTTEDAGEQPVATVDVRYDDEQAAYVYRTLLSTDMNDVYTVAFTCTAGNDHADVNETGNTDPADDTVIFFPPSPPEASPVTIVSGEEVSVDF